MCFFCQKPLSLNHLQNTFMCAFELFFFFWRPRTFPQKLQATLWKETPKSRVQFVRCRRRHNCRVPSSMMYMSVTSSLCLVKSARDSSWARSAYLLHSGHSCHRDMSDERSRDTELLSSPRIYSSVSMKLHYIQVILIFLQTYDCVHHHERKLFTRQKSSTS